MAECLPMSGVLLIGVGKGNVGPMLHIIPRTSVGGDALEEQAAKGGAIKMEGLTSAMDSGRRQGVLPWVAEEVEGKGAQVKNCLGPWAVGSMGEGLNEGSEDGDVDRPDTRGSGVFVCPSLEEGLEVEDIVGAIQPGI